MVSKPLSRKVHIMQRAIQAFTGKTAGWVLLGCILALTQAASAALFVPLGFLPDGNYASFAMAVSDGPGPLTIVGYANTTTLAREPFRWTEADGMVGVGRGGPGQ